MGQIYDITWPLTPGMASWPGDEQYALRWLTLQSRGDTVNLSGLTMSPHLGTHADAPFHCDGRQPTIDQVALDAFVGPARLVDLRGRCAIDVSDLAPYDWTATPRLLLRTGAWDDVHHLPDHIPILAPDVPDFLQAQGICLVGVDVPSVDEPDSPTLPLHHALTDRGIYILEGLDLRLPPPGIYELIALPLKIQGGDGAPIRAIVRAQP